MSVYFMRRADGIGPIKIGCSKWPDDRLAVFQTWAPEPLEIIATAFGSFNDERRLHLQFADHRLHAEWFKPVPEILALVEHVRAEGRLPGRGGDTRAPVMAEMYQSGKTLRQIGERFGITRERARQILRKHDVASLGHRPHGGWCPAATSVDKIATLAKQGATVRDIAEAVGDNIWNVRGVLRKLGVKATHGNQREPDEERVKLAGIVAAEYCSGSKTDTIAKRHGIHQPAVYRLLQIAGVAPSRRPRKAA